MVLFWGVRPEGEITSLPFLLPMGVELFLAASSAPSAVLTAFSLDLSFLDSKSPRLDDLLEVFIEALGGAPQPPTSRVDDILSTREFNVK